MGGVSNFLRKGFSYNMRILYYYILHLNLLIPPPVHDI
uniref:Uncharacterized protein n=1 Tax=Manihot esculenta TaxID=3983 RepID=A0A2C9UZU8_MANES